MKSKNIVLLSKFLKIVGILFLLNGLASIAFSNGSWWFFICLGILSFSLGMLYTILIKNASNSISKVLSKSINFLLLIFFISFIFTQTLILSSAFTKQKDNPDYIVILGAGLWGETPSLILTERLDSSLKLIKELPESTKIIVSGGMGPGESITEAEAMKRYLIKKGVSKDRIIEENRSSDTKENLDFTHKLIYAANNDKDVKITIVTSNFHMFRSRMLAKRAGFININSWTSPTFILLIPTYFIREYAALLKYVILYR